MSSLTRYPPCAQYLTPQPISYSQGHLLTWAVAPRASVSYPPLMQLYTREMVKWLSGHGQHILQSHWGGRRASWGQRWAQGLQNKTRAHQRYNLSLRLHRGHSPLMCYSSWPPKPKEVDLGPKETSLTLEQGHLITLVYTILIASDNIGWYHLPEWSESLFPSHLTPATPLPSWGPHASENYLHGHEHLVLGGAEVVALGQEDLSKGSLAQFSLQHDVSPFNVLHICRRGQRTAAKSVPGTCLPWRRRGTGQHRSLEQGVLLLSPRQGQASSSTLPWVWKQASHGGLRVPPRMKSQLCPRLAPNLSKPESVIVNTQDSGIISYSCWREYTAVSTITVHGNPLGIVHVLIQVALRICIANKLSGDVCGLWVHGLHWVVKNRVWTLVPSPC